MPSLIHYDRYTELLGKRIHRTITPAETEAVARFEAAQPQTCPQCGAQTHSYFLPAQIVHDTAKCTVKTSAGADHP